MHLLPFWRHRHNTCEKFAPRGWLPLPLPHVVGAHTLNRLRSAHVCPCPLRYLLKALPGKMGERSRRPA